MKIKYYLIVTLLTLGMISCLDALNDTPVDLNDAEYVFTDSIRAEAFINSLTNEKPDGVSASYNRLQGNAMLASATDEATHVSTNKSSTNAAWKMSAGNWGPSNMRYYRSSDGAGEVGSWFRWGGYYGIRRANVALDGLQMMRTPIYGSAYFVNRLKGEAIFHKAISHFWLFQKWGGIPIIDRTYTDDENLSIPRSSVEETVNYIIHLCNEAYELFPDVSYSGNESGRYDRGAALALKSRVLLYAASPLYNGSGFDNKNNPLVCYGNTNRERWRIAAEAAKDLINLGWHTLYTGNVGDSPQVAYQKLFYTWSSTNNREYVIVGRLRQPNRDTENDNFPDGFTNASGGTCPSQEMVDAYEMSDGTVFDWNNPVHQTNPYTGRDPRFYASIIYHGATYARFANSSNYTFDMRENGKNRSGNAATTTGYYLNKFMDYTNANPVSGSGSVQHEWVYFRYAEALLNYAEAANEYEGPNYKVSGADITPVDAINHIRARAGMPDVATTFANRGITLNQQTLRDLIRNERRVELAFEEHRYYDVRRWMIVENGNIHGLKITGEANLPKFERVEVEKKIFRQDRDYFFPIPYLETIVNKSLEQNPGWSVDN
ncbi:MAG: RagB/SusD family nutrient uptake outer membrane protein [Dysgonamonadaceae bacterium]|jgi:hypothetical protein|nr:RagB/SusD family nutrient uptake outer membrane protein [Dysgonamonadaceae bacterium]